MKYGFVVVENQHEEERDFYTIRTFLINTNDEEDAEKRKVKQFHFTGWPDMQAPEFAGPVLRLLDEVNEYNPSDVGPIVAHCSAGVGRTGTFITIDSMLKMAKAEGKLDIFNFVSQMRSRRVFMVQTEPQYEFIHDAILEALFCNDTTIANADMERTWAHVNRDRAWLSDQHGALEAMFPPVSVERCTGGRNPENVTKNRYPDRIPPDSSRPYLMSISDSGGTNYINATFCNGYSKDNMYLATQAPLPNTVNDFWCMIYDYKCRTIVALNDPKKQDKTCGHYCPDEGTLTCGAFTIEATSMKRIDNVVKRKLKLYKGNNKEEVVNVTQIQYTDWSGKLERPKSSDSFQQLLRHVEEGRRESGDQRMAIMCMDGVTRCGLLSALISILDQIKEEQQVDVFQAVKRLRKARYDMVHSLAQYKFCYEMARVYLQGFEEYANFTP
ncbi:receptor-type tyrosine-protein phosphatase kappa-like [Amphiura filiformis]|uniref:receptor-type tyrosine-protein phosphatase kappa-like n=1 Tax=Amphiura filiformis TaxID=82378 RepID=UPI003B2149A1